MKFSKAFVIVLALLFLSIGFQNCGNSLQKAQEASGGSSGDSTDLSDTTDGEGPSELPVNFQKGETFDANKIPFALTDATVLNKIKAYSSATGFKAIALTREGGGMVEWSSNDLISGQEEFNQVILERCQLSNGNKPCSLLVSGDVFAQSKDDFLVNFNNVIESPNGFDPLKIPGLIFHWRNYANDTYFPIEAGRFKAYAIGPYGNTAIGYSEHSQADATRRALVFCETLRNEGCAVYAEAGALIFDPGNPQYQPNQVLYSPSVFHPDTVPFVDKSKMAPFVKAYQDIQEGKHVAIAFDKYGYYSIKTSDSPLTQAQINNTINDCTEKLPTTVNRECFLYSLDDKIEMTWKSLDEAAHPF